MKITHYSFGKMIVNGNEYTSDLIILPDRIHQSWWRKEGHSLCIEDLAEIFKSDIDILVVGTGAYGRMRVSDEIINELKKKGIETYPEDTGKAVDLFNKLIEEGRKVAGAFHLTC